MKSSIALPIGMLVAAASIFIIMFGIQASATIPNPILLAIVITISVLPFSHWLMERGMKSWLALVFTVLLVVGGILFVLVLFGIGIAGLSSRIPEYSENISSRAAEIATSVEQFTGQATSSPNSEGASDLLSSLFGFIVSTLATIFTTLLIFIFLTAAAITLPATSRGDVGFRQSNVKRFNALTTDVRKYINVTTVINLLVGILNTILLLIIGVDFALLWGVLSWFLGYIPAVGFWLALIPPTILAWAELGWGPALIVFVGYVLINGIGDNFIAPKMTGESLNISPVIVMLSLIVWGWLLGAIGAILSVPMTLLVLTLMDQFEATRGLAALARTTPKTGEKEDEHSQQQAKGKEQLQRLWSHIKDITRPGDGTNDSSNIGSTNGRFSIKLTSGKQLKVADLLYHSRLATS